MKVFPFGAVKSQKDSPSFQANLLLFVVGGRFYIVIIILHNIIANIHIVSMCLMTRKTNESDAISQSHQYKHSYLSLKGLFLFTSFL